MELAEIVDLIIIELPIQEIPKCLTINKLFLKVCRRYLRILEPKMTQTGIAKEIFEKMCIIIINGCILYNSGEFVDSRGSVIIKGFNESKNLFIKLILSPDNLDSFLHGEYEFGENFVINQIRDIIKILNNDKLFLSYANRKNLHIMDLKDNYFKSKMDMTFKNIDNKTIFTDSIKFQARIDVSMNIFSKICKKLITAGPHTEIVSSNKVQVIQQIENENINVYIGENKIMYDPNIYRGIINSKDLWYFSRFHNLSNSIELYLKNNEKIFLKIYIGQFGTMYGVIHPTESF